MASLDELVIYLNAAAEKQYNVKASEILGRPLTEIYKSDWFQAEDKDEANAALLNTGQWRGENIHIKNNGDIIFVESTVIHIHSQSIQPGLLAVIRDITERKRSEIKLRQSEWVARARREELESLMAAIPAAVFIANDPQCLDMTGNPMGLALLRLSPGSNPSASTNENSAHPDFTFWTGQRRLTQNELPMQKAAATGRVLTDIELSIVFKDGETKHILGNAVPLFNSNREVRGCIGVFLDVTQSKQALINIEEKERLLTESQAIAHIGSWQVDLKSGLISWTDEALRLYGFSPEQQRVNYNFDQFLTLVHPDDRAAMQAWSKACLSVRAQSALEFRACRADGSTIWLQCSGKLETGSDGEALRLVGTIQDINERKRTEAELLSAQETFRNLVQNSPFGIYVIDQDFRLILVSLGAHKIFQNIQPLLNRDFAEIIQSIWLEPFAREIIARFRHTLGTGEPYHSPSTIEQRQDIDELESYDWQIERISLPDGCFGVVCHFYDLSERQRYEQILKAQKAALSDADRQKDEFLAMLGHELRNPLTPISNVAQILTSQSLDRSTLSWAAELLNRNTNHLNKLVDDMLDISRITRGQITLTKEPLDLVELINDSAESVQAIIKAKQQALRFDLPSKPVYTIGDRVRLTQVFTNFLTNASKYSYESGQIDVMARAEDAYVEIVVKDNGMGIEPHLLPKIFDLFIQGTRGLRGSQGGLGLGLALVKRLVRMHDGDIRVYSPGINQGSEFVVKLPIIAGTSARGE